MKTRILSILLAAAMLLSLGVGTAAAENEDVTLRFMWWGSDARHEATIAVCEQYMELHPNVTIEFEYGGYDGYLDKLTTFIASGTEPDVIQWDAKMTADLLSMGDVFVDLNTTADAFDLSNFDTGMINNYCTFDDKIVGVPTGANASAFLVNTAVTDAAGVELSAIATWDDLIAAAKQLQAYHPDMYLLNVEVMNLGETFGYMLTSQLLGENIVSDDGQLNLTVEDLTKIYELYEQFYASGVLEPAEDSILYDTNPWTNPKWINHEYGIGYFITSYINDTCYDFQDTSAVIPLPQFEGAKEAGIMYIPAQLISISANSKNVEAAADFLNYFYNDETALETLGTVRSIPANSLGQTITVEQGLVDPNIITAIGFANDAATKHQNLNIPSSVVDILQDGAEKIAYGVGSAAEVAQETYDAVVAQLAYLQSQ